MFSQYKPIKTNYPQVAPFLRRIKFMHKLYKPWLKDATYEIPLYLDYWFTRRRAL